MPLILLMKSFIFLVIKRSLTRVTSILPVSVKLNVDNMLCI